MNYFDEFNNAFRKMMEQFPDFANVVKPLMRADIYQTSQYYIYDIELPGFNKGEIHVDLKDGDLVVSATHASDNERKNYGELIHKERMYPNMTRHFAVDRRITSADVTAKYDGFNLVLSLRKPTEASRNGGITIE